MTKKSSFIVFLALAISAALFAGSYLIAQRLCAKKMASSTDDLDWLRQGFNLGAVEMKRIRELHDGYLPKCAAMCKQIASKKQELEAALAGTTNISMEAEQKLSELGALRAQCQTQMLRHFAEVSQAMPPEQGQRYLAEMQRLTLGFHEQIEQSMSPPVEHQHGNH